MTGLRTILTVLAAVASAGVSARGDCPGSWLPWPNVGLAGTNGGGVFTTTEWDPDGDGPMQKWLVVGGHFAQIGDVPANRLAAWDGQRWRAFGLGANSTVNALAVYEGKLVVGGAFTWVDGVTCQFAAMYDGTSWTAMGPSGGTGLGISTTALFVHKDKLYAGSYGSTQQRCISRWNGSNWDMLGTGISTNHSNYVLHMCEFQDDLIVCGYFSAAGGQPASNIARWDGTSWHPLGAGVTTSPNLGARGVAVYDGYLYVGGGFWGAGGASLPRHLARWDGVNWSSIGVIDDVVNRVFVFNDELIVGGYFNLINGATHNGVARWNGTSWLGMGTGIVGGALPACFDLGAFNNELVVPGGFESAGPWPSVCIARWTPDGIPVVVTHPIPQTVEHGATAELTITASYGYDLNGPLTYQWRHDAVPLKDGGDISGALTPSLAITNIQVDDAGSYDCLVSNTCGTVTSSAGVLSVTPPPTCPGDANGDGLINGADLSVLLSQFGSSVTAGTGGDFNGDGMVDGADLSVMLGAFGEGC